MLSIVHMGIWELIGYVRLVLVTVRHVFNLCHSVLHVYLTFILYPVPVVVSPIVLLDCIIILQLVTVQVALAHVIPAL